MSFVSAADIVGAIKLGWWIYDKHFNNINRAEERYMEFGGDVKYLTKQLEDLQNVFKKASQQSRQYPHGLSEDIHTERQQIVGDFPKTLQQCKQLLQENKKYASGTFANTIRWYTTGLESQSLLLKDRLQFHCAKINFLLKPLELELLGRIDRGIATLRRQNREQLKVLHALKPPEQESTNTLPTRVDRHGLVEVPSNLASRYEEQAHGFRPFVNSSEFPLQESLNALLYHINESTVHGGGRFNNFSLSQYNALIKSRWLLGKILDSPSYKRLQRGLSLTVIENITDEIDEQYGLFKEDWDLEVAEQIVKFSDSHFCIWIEDQIEPLAPVATEEGPGETKILELRLPPPQGYTQQSLLVFRQTETEYRLLRFSRLDGANMEIPSEKQIVNVHSFRFIPYYAVPGSESNSVQICHNDVHQGDIFDMATKEDVFCFQRALTGYKVSFAVNVRWAIERDKWWDKRMDGEGQSGLQIWEWDPLGRVGSIQGATESDDGGTNGQTSSLDPQTSSYASVVAGLPGEAASVLTVPNSQSGQTEIIASSSPKVPLLVLFSKVAGKLSFLHLRLELGMAINTDRCGCGLHNSDCRESFLEMNPRKKGIFKMRKFSAPNKDEQPVLADWNLLLFGQPTHPGFESATTAVTKISRLQLELETPEDRRRFQLAFINAMDQYETRRTQFDRFRAKMKYFDQKPNTIATGLMASTNADSTLQSRQTTETRRVSTLPSTIEWRRESGARNDSVVSSSQPSANLTSLQSRRPTSAYRPSTSDAVVEDSTLRKNSVSQRGSRASPEPQSSTPQPEDRLSFTSLSGNNSRRSNSLGATSSAPSVLVSAKRKPSRGIDVAHETLHENEEREVATDGSESKARQGLGIRNVDPECKDEGFETGTSASTSVSRSSTLVENPAMRSDPYMSVTGSRIANGKPPAVMEEDPGEITPAQAQANEVSAKLASVEYEESSETSKMERLGSNVMALGVN